MVASSVLELVGNTPLVELKRLSPSGVRLLAKLEGQNPTGSIKDRVAKAMIEAAEASGDLEPGGEILEPTSGNTGISLALVARLKGYTGGKLMGVGRRLRERFSDVAVVTAEPLPGDPVMGLRSLDDGYVPPILDVQQLDRKILVSNAEAVAGMRALLEEEGIFAGVLSGGVLHVARRVAGELDDGGVVVAILPDGGWKYLSVPLWEADDVEQAMEHAVWW